MANHDYIIDNGSGSTVRADINSALQAIKTVNSGASEPPNPDNQMLWHDTTGGVDALKQRNSGSFTGLRLFDPRIINDGLFDANGKMALGINATANAANSIRIANAAIGNSPVVTVTSSGQNPDTNINLTLAPIGTGSVFVPTGSTTNPSVSVSTDSNTGIYFPSADTMGFVEGGTGYQMGYRNVPSAGADKTTSYTLQLSDRGKLVSIGSSGGITVPANVFSAGDIIYIYNNTANPFTITRGTDPNVPATLAQLYQSGIDSDVSSIAVPTRTMGAIQYVSSSTAVFFSGSQNETAFQLEYVIVAGGGSGGGGGGGAGGFIAGKNSGTVDGINYGSAENQGGGIPAENPIYVKKGIAYNVAIGAGGAGTSTASQTADSAAGFDTYFNNLLAIGGGGGKHGGSSSFTANLNTSSSIRELFTTIVGGSGGGGYAGSMRAFPRQGYLGGNGTQPNGGYGYNGGGGASAVGASTPNSQVTGYQNGGAGGAGLTTTILAASQTLAGGGGGGGGWIVGSLGAAGGSGGGGAGGGSSDAGTNGTVNTGGGGGGKGYNATGAHGNGGSGVILLRIPNTVTATSSTSGSPPTSDLTIAESTTTVDNITFKTLKITAGIGTITFN